MGQHRSVQFSGSYEKGVIHVYANIAIGASGAPTIVKSKNQGIKSVVRNSAGDYTITFGNSVTGEVDKYQRLLFVEGIVLNATASAIVQVIPLADNSASGTIEVVCSSATATAADPEDGSTLLLHFVLKNSTVV